MRYFIEKFEETHNKEWPFGQFPAYNYYPSTGTHIGTDFAIPIGTSIFAPMDGEMFKVYISKPKGNVGIFIFEHKSITWGLELCHLRELPKLGKRTEGDTIAYSGMTGEKVDGAHLHAVLHRNAHVTKHYGLLTSREAFLKLEKEGAIVDCFEWFCTKMKETPKPQPVVNAPEKPKTPQPTENEPAKPKVKQTPVPQVSPNKGFWI